MITIENGAFQDAGGNAVTGTLTLTLSNDSQEAVTSPNGQVAAGVPVSYAVTAGNVSASSIWSNLELSPAGTYYVANLTTSTGANAWLSARIWVFSQTTGSTVDLGTMIPTSIPGNPSYPAPYFGFIFYVDGYAYPQTGAGIQAAINAAAGVGSVWVPFGTYVLSATLNIPSHTKIYWDHATLTMNGYSGDMIASSNTTDIHFSGTLILNGAGRGTSATSYGIDFTSVSNYFFDDIEGENIGNGTFQLWGCSNVIGRSITSTNGDTLSGSTSAAIFIGNYGSLTSSDILIDSMIVNGQPGGDGVYIQGTISNPVKRFNFSKINIISSGDCGVEVNYATGNIGQINVAYQGAVNVGCLIRRTSSVNVDSVVVMGGMAIGVDIPTYTLADGPMKNINVGKIYATNCQTDTTNGAAVRIFCAGAGAAISNVTIGQILSDTSTRGLRLIGAVGTPLEYISIGQVVTHHNLGDGVQIIETNQSVITNVISYDNNQGGVSGDTGVGLWCDDSVNVMLGTVQCFDDQVSMTQKYGVYLNTNAQNVTLGLADLQDAQEVTGGFNDLGTQNICVRRKNNSNGFTIEEALTIGGGLGVYNSLSANGTFFLNAATPSTGVVSGQIALGNTTSNTATVGGGAATPATVLGFLEANVNGTLVKIPYYSV